MLAFEPSRHDDQPYPQSLSMETCMQHQLGALDGDCINPFEAYSTFPSDPYPFIVRPSPLVLDDETSKKPLGKHPFPNSTPAPLPHSVPNSAERPLSTASSTSTSSSHCHSANSGPPSTAGSPPQESWTEMDPASGFDGMPYGSASLDQEVLFSHSRLPDDFIDPSLIQPIPNQSSYPPPVGAYHADPQYGFASAMYPTTSPPTEYPGFVLPTHHQPQQQPQPHFVPQQQQQPPHENPHHRQQHQHPHHHQQEPQHVIPPPQPEFRQQSPYLIQNSHTPRQTPIPARPSSASSNRSRHTPPSPHSGNVELDEESRESHRCPHPDCGRVFRDLRAHMLTHQSERPEKCPIVTCEYHFKGFARKYDKNRHTLTHYKGTMVCGFCPGSGSAAEKSFNRADVFKRHLTSVHGVDQSAPNCRKKSPASAAKLSNYCQDATGKCSTCGSTFSNAQDFYEHLDDCVLRVVQQEEPSEAINQKLLNEVASDGAVRETMQRHMLPDSTLDGGQDSHNDDSNEASKNGNDGSSGKSTSLVKSSGPAGVTKQRPAISRRRNNRNNYPPSWGCPTNKMKMKRRLLCLYEGPRRLWKDEMMLDNEFEVRLKLPGGGDGVTGRDAYVTDLDVETLKRAQGVLSATEEEKGPWVPTPGSNNGLIGPAAVPIVDNPSENVEEVNIEELMS